MRCPSPAHVPHPHSQPSRMLPTALVRPSHHTPTPTAHRRFLSPPLPQTTTSLEAPQAPTEALTCLPWAGNHPASKLFLLLAHKTTATSILSRNTRHKTACTTNTTTSAGPTAPNQTTTTPTNGRWATECGLPLFNRRELTLC